LRILLLSAFLLISVISPCLSAQHNIFLSQNQSADTLVQQQLAPEAKPQANEEQPDQKETNDNKSSVTNPPDIKGIISFSKIFWSVVFIVIGYFLLKAVSGVLTLVSDRKPKYQSTIRRLLPMIKIFGWAFISYIIISAIFQPPRETVFAFFASIGVAIGFASQDLLKNIFGGLMILFDRPFQVGDKIESGNFYGEVLEVGLRSTRIVTPDDSVVTIPNSEMMNQSISNSNSSENNCQVIAEVYLPHTIDTKKVREIATEVAQVSKYIYLNKPIAVLFFSEKTNQKPMLKMRLKAYVNNLRHEFAFKSEMTEFVLKELIKEGLISQE
jgi:small-conductance mechanosensitive channel